MKEKIPYKFKDSKGVDWVVSPRFPGSEPPMRLIATDKPTDDYGKRDMRMISEGELRTILPPRGQHPRSSGSRRP